MVTSEQVQRVRIYLRERDRWEGEPLYMAILNRLQQEGATGATALRGLAGFGPGYLVRTATGGNTGNDAPVVIEWVDRAERINRLLPLLDTMLPTALTTIEQVGIYRAALRARGPFSDATTVGDIAIGDVVTVGLDEPIGVAVFTMLGREQELLPVLDDAGKLAGVITGSDLQRRAGLKLPLRLLRLLSVAERRPFMEPIAAVSARSCMTTEPRSVNAMADVLQAIVSMLELNYTTLPVLERDGRFVGVLTREAVLRAASQQNAAEESAVRDAEPPTRVQLVMQMSVPQASATQPLAAILADLLAAPQRFLVLTDAAGRVRGTLSDVDALRGFSGDDRARLLAALSGDEVELPGSDRGAEQFVQQVQTLSPDMTIEEAIQRFVSMRIERAPVIDNDGKLLGLIASHTLLRALAQSS